MTLQDLLDDLLWPQLLRSWKLALAPGRVAMCFLFVLMLFTVKGLYHRVTGARMFAAVLDSVGEDVARVFTTHKWPEAAAISAYNLFVEVPWRLVIDHPVVALVYLPLILLAWCAVGGAVCRSCACEVSLRAALPWRSAVRFGLGKTLALFAAIAGPLVAVWGACLVLKLLGLAFFTTKALGLLGGAFFVVPLVLCLVVAAAATAYLLAHSLLIPAVACEGTDSFDAVQRCYAYVLARPGRLLGYTGVSLLTIVPAALIFWMICTLAILMALSLSGAPMPQIDPIYYPVEKEGYAATGWMVQAWIWIVLALMNAYFISLYFCAATNLYLVVRRLVDGQDVAELWTPPQPPSQSIPAAPTSTATAEPSLPPLSDKADYT